MKFEMLCDSEDQALFFYDSLAAAMKMYGWEEPIHIWSDMPDPTNPTEVQYSIRVGDWSKEFSA